MKMWPPVNDGRFQLGHFSQRIIQNQRPMIPLLISNTSTESVESPKVRSIEELETLAKEQFGDQAGKFMEAVRGDTLEETIRNATFCPMELGMRLYFEGGHQGRPGTEELEFRV